MMFWFVVSVFQRHHLLRKASLQPDITVDNTSLAVVIMAGINLDNVPVTSLLVVTGI